MNANQRLDKYDYYNSKSTNAPSSTYKDSETILELIDCPLCVDLEVEPSNEWDKSIAEHNEDVFAHPHILSLIKDSNSNYYSVDSITDRDNIGKELRGLGLMAYVVETDTLYRLEGGIENTNWAETNVNSKKLAKLGRFNPPSNPENGMVYFDLISERLTVYYNGSWNKIPNQKDIEDAILNHEEDPNAHASRFKEVENRWLAI